MDEVQADMLRRKKKNIKNFETDQNQELLEKDTVWPKLHLKKLKLKISSQRLSQHESTYPRGLKNLFS